MSREKNDKLILFKQIIDFIKIFLNQKNDFEVAKILGIKQSTFSDRKSRGEIPYKEIIKFCTKYNIPLDEMFGIKKKDSGQPGMTEAFIISEVSPPEYHIPPRLEDIIDKIKIIYFESSPENLAKMIGMIELFLDEIKEKKAAIRYNKTKKGKNGNCCY